MWVRIDDRLPRHPKFEGLTSDAAWLWICGNCYASTYLTDGFVSFKSLPTISVVLISDIQKSASDLVSAGLWHEAEGGYFIHDYHDFNPTAEQVKAKLDADRARKRSGTSKQNPVRIPADSAPTTYGQSVDSAPGIQTDSNAPRARVPVPSRPVPSRPKEPEPEPRSDVNFAEFQNAYPQQRRQGGFMASQGYLDALEKAGGHAALLACLERHKRSDQWAIAGRIPSMRKWFEDELWRQELPPPRNGNGHSHGSSGRPKPPTVEEIRRANERPPS